MVIELGYSNIYMYRNVITYLNESNSQLGDGDGSHEDGQEKDNVIKEAGSEVQQVQRDIEELVAGAHAEENLTVGVV